MMKKSSVLLLSLMAMFAITPAIVMAAPGSPASVAPNRVYAHLGRGVWTSGTDGFGNVWTFGARHRGQITSSPYLLNIPWSTKYSQTKHTNNFVITAKDPDSTNGQCSFQYTGSFTSSTSASGTWVNLPTGSTTCGQSGTFTMSASGVAVAITTTGGRPGVAS
jgi:hypothetical protein